MLRKSNTQNVTTAEAQPCVASFSCLASGQALPGQLAWLFYELTRRCKVISSFREGGGPSIYNFNSSSALEQETKHFCMSLGGQRAKDDTLQHWQVCASEEKGISPLSCAAAPTAGAWNQIVSEVTSYPIRAVI